MPKSDEIYIHGDGVLMGYPSRARLSGWDMCVQGVDLQEDLEVQQAVVQQEEPATLLLETSGKVHGDGVLMGYLPRARLRGGGHVLAG